MHVSRGGPARLVPAYHRHALLTRAYVNRLPASDGYQHSLTVPYHTTLSAHHPNRTTTPVSVLVQPPPSQSSRYLHPVLLSAQGTEARARATLPFPSLIGPTQGDLGLGRAPSSHRAIDQASRPGLRLTCPFKYQQSPQPQILPPESLLYHTQTLRQQYYQALSAKPALSPRHHTTNTITMELPNMASIPMNIDDLPSEVSLPLLCPPSLLQHS